VARRYREEVDRQKLVQALEDREKLNSTALGEGSPSRTVSSRACGV